MAIEQFQPQPIVLSPTTIKQYICKDATEQELQLFYELCVYRNLNPFLNEAYLIKYSPKTKAQMVVGKDVFTKRADEQPDFEGFEAGIIVFEVVADGN